MKRALIILAFLAIGVAIALATYILLDNGEAILPYKELDKKAITVTGGTNFSGKFAANVPGKEIVGYDYKMKGNNLYITVYATSGSVEPMKTDKEGFVSIAFSTDNAIKKVYYRTTFNDRSIAFSNKKG